MNTTFGIIVKNVYDEDFIEVEVAFRSGGIRWLNPPANLLPDDTKVEPLDNSAQGIYTIGDIKAVINQIEN